MNTLRMFSRFIAIVTIAVVGNVCAMMDKTWNFVDQKKFTGIAIGLESGLVREDLHFTKATADTLGYILDNRKTITGKDIAINLGFNWGTRRAIAYLAAKNITAQPVEQAITNVPVVGQAGPDVIAVGKAIAPQVTAEVGAAVLKAVAGYSQGNP